MDPNKFTSRISVDVRIGDKFVAVITSWYGPDKTNVIELEGFDQCGKEVWHDFITKRNGTLSFCRSTKGEVSLTWEDANLKIIVGTSSKYRGANSTHYFPADFMADALSRLVGMME